MSSNDIKIQQIVDKALNQAGLPQNKLNGLIAMAKDHLMCNADCQKARESSKLKQIWETAQSNLKTAPSQEEIAEKNYYVYDKGYSKYQDLLFDRYSKTAQEMKESSLLKHKTLLNELKTLMTKYEAETIYSIRMHELLKLRKKENKQLREDIDDYIKNVQTAARKVDYTTIESTWITKVRKGLLFFYYSLLIVYFLISDYFITAKYKDKKVWLMIVVYFIFPYFLNWLIIQLYYLKTYIHHLFTTRPFKNVYE